MRRKDYSEQTAQVIDKEIKKILDSHYEVAKGILTKHKKVLEKGAALVRKEENIADDRLKKLLSVEKKPNSMILVRFNHPHGYLGERGFDAQDRISKCRNPKIHYSSVPSFQ